MKKTTKIIGIGLIIFIIGGLGGLFFDYIIFSKVIANPVWSQNTIIKALDNRVKVIKTTEKIIVADNESTADIASRAATTVAYIESVNTNLGMTTTGNGVVVSSDGVIVTTTAVVPVGSTVQYVKLSSDAIYDVTDMYVDEYSDIVFLRINAENLATIPFANSDDARSGKRLISIARTRTDDDARFALGGFLGHDYTLSIAQPMSDFLQGVLSVDFSDTVLHKSVGSPVVDFQGNMVGLISYKEGADMVQKEFYAVAANDVYQSFENFLRVNNDTKVNNILLGINYHIINSLDVHIDDINITNGVVIDIPQAYAEQKVFASTLAAQNGLRGGDIIVMVNNEIVDAENNLSRLMHDNEDTSSIALKVLRDDELLTVDVVM